MTPRVLVLTRQGCHLCDQAIEMVAAVCAEAGERYETRDVDDDPELRQTYTDQVPVTFVDGAQHDFWRVDPVRLRAALARPRPVVDREGGRPPSDPPHVDREGGRPPSDPPHVDREGGRPPSDPPHVDREGGRPPSDPPHKS